MNERMLELIWQHSLSSDLDRMMRCVFLAAKFDNKDASEEEHMELTILVALRIQLKEMPYIHKNEPDDTGPDAHNVAGQ